MNIDFLSEQTYLAPDFKSSDAVVFAQNSYKYLCEFGNILCDEENTLDENELKTLADRLFCLQDSVKRGIVFAIDNRDDNLMNLFIDLKPILSPVCVDFENKHKLDDRKDDNFSNIYQYLKSMYLSILGLLEYNPNLKPRPKMFYPIPLNIHRVIVKLERFSKKAKKSFENIDINKLQQLEEQFNDYLVNGNDDIEAQPQQSGVLPDEKEAQPQQSGVLPDDEKIKTPIELRKYRKELQKAMDLGLLTFENNIAKWLDSARLLGFMLGILICGDYLSIGDNGTKWGIRKNSKQINTDLWKWFGVKDTTARNRKKGKNNLQELPKGANKVQDICFNYIERIHE